MLTSVKMGKPATSASVRRGNRPSDQNTGPKGSPMTPIPSASLIVLCPTSSSPNRYETVMLQRSARDGSSFRSAVVFPGGALDLADETPYLTDDPFNAPSAEDALKVPPLTMEKDGARYMAALKLCALRETFEETGLLLVPGTRTSSSAGAAGPPRSRAIGHKDVGMTSKEWAKFREEVHNDASVFPALLRRVASAVADPSSSPLQSQGSSKGIPPLAPISHHSNWITPRSVVRPAKRFDAHFFITVLDAVDVFGAKQGDKPTAGGQAAVVEISADGTETTSLKLTTPGTLVQEALQDTFVLFPPQFYILADLACAMEAGPSLKGIVPLNFCSTLPKSSSSGEKAATPVEEEAHRPEGRSFAWDTRNADKENPSSSTPSRTETPWVSYTEPPFVPAEDWRIQAKDMLSGVTAIEPHPMPRAGTNVAMPTRTASGEWEQDTEDQPFTFPLCLPGDRDQSRDQAAVAGLSYSTAKKTGTAGAVQPENRLFVSPRTKADGGGLVVRGIRRRAIAGLRDFQYGTVVDKQQDQQDEEEEEEQQQKKAKL